MKLIYLTSILTLLATGCVNASVDVDTVCSYEELQTTSPLLAGKTGTVQYVTRPNFGDATSKLDDFGEVQLTLKNAIFSTKEKVDVTFVKHVSVSFVREDDSEVLLAETVPSSGDTIVLEFKEVPAEVTEAVKQGHPKLRTRATGTMPSVSFTPTISICGSAHAEGKVSLDDIKK